MYDRRICEIAGYSEISGKEQTSRVRRFSAQTYCSRSVVGESEKKSALQLEWIYKQVEVEEAAREKLQDEEILPPLEILEQLYELARG